VVRRPVSGRVGVRSQVINVLEARIKRRPAIKKVSTEAAKQSRKISEQKFTVGPSPILTDRSRNAVGHVTHRMVIASGCTSPDNFDESIGARERENAASM
jgi:hypothetical protein